MPLAVDRLLRFRDNSVLPLPDRTLRWWIPMIYLGLGIAFFLPSILLQRVPLPLENAYSYPDPYWVSYRPATLSSPPNFAGVDITNYWYPYMWVVVERLQRGEIPLWNPQMFSGMPLLGAQQAAVIYPLNILFAPLGPFWIWTATGIVRLGLMGWGLHLLMRRFAVSHLAAFWSGVTYQFCAVGIAYLHWSNHNVLAFLPFALYASVRLIDTPSGRWFLLLMASLAFQFFGGHPETSFLFAIVWFTWTLFYLVWQPQVLRSLLLVAGAVIAATGLALPQLLLALQLIPESVTFAQRRSDEYLALLQANFGSWSHVRQWLFIINPYLYGTPLGNRMFVPDTEYHWTATYLGIATVAWSVVGIWGGRPRRIVLYWTCLALISLNLIFVLPGFDLIFRLPVLNFGLGARFNFTWSLAAAVLAGFGVDWLLRGDRARRWVVFGLGTLALVLLGWTVFDLAGAARGSWVLQRKPGDDVLRRIAAFYNRDNVQLVGLLGSALLGWLVLLALLVTRRTRLAVAALLVITCGELFFHGIPFNGLAQPAAIFPETRITRALRASGDRFRIATLDTVMDANTALTQGLDDAFGNDDLVSRRYQHFAGRRSKIGLADGTYVIQPPAQRFFDLANVEYLLTTRPVSTTTPAGDWRLVMQDEPVRVYRNPSVLPRAYVVARVQVFSPEEAIGAVYQPTFDPRRVAIVEEPIGLLEARTDQTLEATADITQYEPERVSIKVTLSSPGLLVLADSYDAGWRVTVDGQPAPLYRANAVYRGVALPAGSHRVVFVYRPAAWELGLRVMALTLVVSVGGCALARIRRERAAQRIRYSAER